MLNNFVGYAGEEGGRVEMFPSTPPPHGTAQMRPHQHFFFSCDSTQLSEWLSRLYPFHNGLLCLGILGMLTIYNGGGHIEPPLPHLSPSAPSQIKH